MKPGLLVLREDRAADRADLRRQRGADVAQALHAVGQRAAPLELAEGPSPRCSGVGELDHLPSVGLNAMSRNAACAAARIAHLLTSDRVALGAYVGFESVARPPLGLGRAAGSWRHRRGWIQS